MLLGDQCECALLKVAVAVMKAVEPHLMKMNDLEDVLGYLKIEVTGGPGWRLGFWRGAAVDHLCTLCMCTRAWYRTQPHMYARPHVRSLGGR